MLAWFSYEEGYAPSYSAMTFDKAVVEHAGGTSVCIALQRLIEERQSDEKRVVTYFSSDCQDIATLDCSMRYGLLPYREYLMCILYGSIAFSVNAPWSWMW
jgi:hypothetical protein